MNSPQQKVISYRNCFYVTGIIYLEQVLVTAYLFTFHPQMLVIYFAEACAFLRIEVNGNVVFWSKTMLK